MKKTLFTILFVSILSTTSLAQERQVELYVDASKGQSANLGGRLWLDAGDRIRMVGDVNFSQALNIFSTGTTDIVEIQGTPWVFLTAFDGSKASQTRPFLFGGVQSTQFIGQANDSVAIPMGFGLQHFRQSGFEFTNSIEFRTKNLMESNPLIDKAFTYNSYIKVPLSKVFRLTINPYVGREEISGAYFTKYGAKIGFARTF